MENYYFKHPSHFNDMFTIFEDYYRNKTLSDVIISCQGRNIYAHRLILCAGSDHFRRLLSSIKCYNQLPVLIITDIQYEDIEIIIEFIYRGQIIIKRDKLETLRQAAYKLRVRGFENFIRKSFNNNLNSIDTIKLTNGINNNSIQKRYLQQLNENDLKRLKSMNNFEKHVTLYNNNNDYQQKNMRQLTESPQPQQQSHLETALQQGLNQSNQQSSLSEDMIKRMFQLEQLMKSCNGNNNNNNNDVYDCNGTLDLKIDKQHKQDDHRIMKISNSTQNGVTVNMMNCNSSNISNDDDDENNNDHFIDSCNEIEDNQRNETTENFINNRLQKRQNYDNQRNNSEASMNEINYTYELDPSVLVPAQQWDNSDDQLDNLNNNNNNDNDDKDYDDTNEFNNDLIINANGNNENNEQNSMMESMMMVAQKINQINNGNFFYCEHCPKYFVDEDQLQLHIKRTHGINRMNQCNICGKAYAWKSGLYKHKRHVHNIGGSSVNNRYSNAAATSASTMNLINNNSMNNNGDSCDSPMESQSPSPTQIINNNHSSVEMSNNKNGRIMTSSPTQSIDNNNIEISSESSSSSTSPAAVQQQPTTQLMIPTKI